MDLSRKEVPVSGQVGVCVGVQAGASVPEGLEYYVVLEGSTLSHVTSAQGCADGLSFKFTAPGHNMAECVLIRLCQYECGRPFLLPWFGELFLEYMQDEAQEISEVPLSHPGNLNSTRYLELSEKSPGRGTSSAERGHKLGAFTQDSTDHLWGWNQRPAEWDDVSDVSSGVVIIRETEEKNLPLNEQEKRACQASYNTDYPHKWGNLGSQGEQGHNVKQERFSVELTQTGTGRTLSESPALTGGLVLFSVWADHSRLLRFCPNSGSFALTVRRDVHTDTHGNIQFYRQKLTDQHVRTQVRDLRGGVVEVEREKKEKYGASDDRDFAGQHNIEDHTLPDSVFEEQLVLSLDEEEEDLITVSPEEPCSPPPSCGSPQFNSTHIAANRLTAMLNRKSQNDDRNMKLSVAGVTDDSSVTDSGLWRADEGGALLLGSTDTPPPCEDEAQGQKGISSFSPSVSLSLSSSPVSCSPTGLTLDRVLRYACFESANQSMTSPPSCDLSPTLVALEMDSEDDDDDEILIKKPLPQIPPDHNSNDNEQDVRNPAPDLTCIRSHSASSVTSDAPSKDSSDQGVRLRSYSYSSPKISLLPPRFSRDTRSPNSDLAADGAISSSSGSRSLLQALSLSKSLSLLNPVKQRAFSLTEQSQVKRELRFRRRAQSAEDESSIELADSLQHLTLSEFLKEIEEEEWDKYIIPSKNESEKYKVSRTFSFIKSRMYSTRNKSKGKGKEREGKDKQTTGHLFSAGNCVGPAMCVVCEKLATGKDLLHCSNCALVVHKGCKDSATQCLKKTQDKYSVSMVKNRTASLPQNFTVRDRSSSPLMVTSTSIPVMTSHERREAPSTCPLSRSVPTVTERFSESPEEDSDSSPWRNHIQSEELLQTTESSTSTDSSLMEDTVDAPLQNELAMDSLDLEAESWSLVVDPQFCRAQEKHIIKRQDIIYELMQTELHHVQTLTIMAEVFWRGMREEVQLEPETIGRIFPCLDELLLLHHNFLLALRDRRHSSALPDGDRNYVIHSIGDILLQQFSQENAERMKQVYGQFCSHHLEAVSFFKELQQQNKRFQIFIKQQSYNSLVKRREIPECILLVTQRITKYPVLLERLLQHTLEGTKEYDDVGRALVSIRELIAAVDLRVSEYDRSQRLQDILGRLENKSAAKLKGGHTFRKPDITAGRAVIHHGPLLWKTATGRLKDIMALLLTDTLVFLQEKDQKFLFASVDQKPPVISLQKLIVREVANEERGMFLISASASGPEMYEVHSSSKDERNTWMRLIREAVESCPEEQDETTSESEEERRVAEAKVQKIRKLQELLCNQDEQICSNLEEKLQIFAELSSLRGDGERGAEAQLLLRPGPDDTPQATLLLAAALKETEKLKATLSGLSDGSSSPLLNSLEEDSVPSQRSPSADAHRDEEEEEREGEEGLESHTLSSLHSAIDMDNHNINVQVAQSVQSLTQLLYSLQATVTMQDSLYEVQKHLLHSHSYPAHPRGPALQEQERQREAELRRAELAGVARLRERLAQERHCWERKCQARQQQQNELERGLEARERECHLEARKLQRGRQELQEQQQDYQQSLERLREGQRSVEREREQLELQRSLLQNWRHHRQSSLPAMLIPLDEVQNFCQDQTSAPDEDGSSLFLNEAVLHTPSLNNRHLHRYNHQHHPRQTLHQCSPDSPSSQNSLNSLLAQANHRHTSDIDLNNAWPAVHTPSFPGLSTAIANTADMGTQGQVQVVWSQEPMGAGNHAHHLTGNAHLDSQAFVAMETEGEEDGAEENIVYL